MTVFDKTEQTQVSELHRTEYTKIKLNSMELDGLPMKAMPLPAVTFDLLTP